MDSDTTDPIWKLLEQSPAKRASGAFAQNVVREVRQIEADSREECCGGLWAWLSRRALISGAAIAAVALVATFGLFHSADLSSTGTGIAAATNAPEAPVLENPQNAAAAIYLTSDEENYTEVLTEELEVMTFVDELLTVADPSQLDDAALAELLF